MEDRMYRSPDDRMIAGIAGGMAERWDLDPSLVRIAWVVLGLFTAGFAIVFYVLLAIVIPMAPVAASAPPEESVEQERDTPPERRARRAERRAQGRRPGSGGVLLGAILIVVGGYFLVAQLVPWFDIGRLWPLLVIALGVAVLFSAGSRAHGGLQPTSEGPESAPSSTLTPR